jgi:hypothetical protein
MKTGVIFYHKNSSILYEKRWIDKCIDTILNQSYPDFNIYELNYGGDDFSIFSGINHNRDLNFYSKKFENHAEAMNFIIDTAFCEGCDVVFNTNVDDFYSLDRFKEQLEILSKGYDLVSSDFYYVKDFNEKELDVVTNGLCVSNEGSIEDALEKNNNVIAHPCVAFSKKFWGSNRYNPEEIPEEDLLLWKRGIESGMKFYIIPEKLLFYRIHQNQISSSPVLLEEKKVDNSSKSGGSVWFNDYNI